MRRMKKISQDEASRLCGYSRATIGHIENGRIEHILGSYGSSYSEFKEVLGKDKQRDEVIDTCLKKIYILSNKKLNLLNSLLQNF